MDSVRRTLREAGIEPRRHRGQNFLADENILRKIADAADVQQSDTVLEVGPGLGALTERLVQRAGRVIAVEIDKDLATYLQKKFAEEKNLTIIKDDILAIERESTGLLAARYKLVANIPYNITSRLVRSFLEEAPRPARMVLLVQREVAERMCARTAPFSLLALSVQYFGTCRVLFRVSRECFYPKPKVESAVVEIVPHHPAPARADQERFFRVLRAGFAAKRKKLFSNLSSGLSVDRNTLQNVFTECGIAETARAEELSLDDWKRLAANFQ